MFGQRTFFRRPLSSVGSNGDPLDLVGVRCNCVLVGATRWSSAIPHCPEPRRVTANHDKRFLCTR